MQYLWLSTGLSYVCSRGRILNTLLNVTCAKKKELLFDSYKVRENMLKVEISRSLCDDQQSESGQLEHQFQAPKLNDQGVMFYVLIRVTLCSSCNTK